MPKKKKPGPAPPATKVAHGGALLSNEAALALLCGLAALLLYANTLGHLYAIDDNLVIYKNRYVQQGLAALPEIFSTPFTHGISKINDNGYRPLTVFTFALEHQLFGSNAFFPQHLFQVLLFATTCGLLFLLLRRLLSYRGLGLAPALAATLLFLAHPVHTEVVANLKSRDELLALLLGLVVPLLLLLRHLESGRRKYLALAAGVFFLGLLSKEAAITHLAVIPLTLYVFAERPLRQVLRLALPFLLAAAVYLGVRYLVLSRFPKETYDMLQNTLLGGDLEQRYATAMVVMLRYLGLLFYPHSLVWDYSYNQIPLVRLTDPRAILSILLHVSLAVWALRGLRRRSLIACCILMYLCNLSVSSNLFFVGPSIMGERFLFAPSLGFCLALALTLARLLKAGAPDPARQRLWQLGAALSAILVPFCVKTVSRSAQWKDSLTVSLADINTSPQSIRVQSTLAAVYLAMAKQEEAPAVKREMYRRVIPLAQSILKLYPAHKEAMYNIGICYFFLGDFDRAESAFREHLKKHPDDFKTYNNLGGLYYFRRDYETALTYFKKFVDRNPKDAKAVNNLGVVYLDNLKSPRKAIPYFLRAIALDRSFAEPHRRLGDARMALGELPQAIRSYENALLADPMGMAPLRQRIRELQKKAGKAGP